MPKQAIVESIYYAVVWLYLAQQRKQKEGMAAFICIDDIALGSRTRLLSRHRRRHDEKVTQRFGRFTRTSLCLLWQPVAFRQNQR
jgi:hypothetical protein